MENEKMIISACLECEHFSGEPEYVAKRCGSTADRFSKGLGS
jgi:hypothetical protein